jgi:pyruvate/2-oxoglutarate dehydrogenase complex dihydrolipoamide acyltransferase (E2) component
LVSEGDALEPGQPIVCLLDDDLTDVRVPDGVRGQVKSRLVAEGAQIALGNPLLTFVPQNDVGPVERHAHTGVGGGPPGLVGAPGGCE